MSNGQPNCPGPEPRVPNSAMKPEPPSQELKPCTRPLPESATSSQPTGLVARHALERAEPVDGALTGRARDVDELDLRREGAAIGDVDLGRTVDVEVARCGEPAE